MKLKPLGIILVTLSILNFPCLSYASSYVSVNHRVYDFLERMEHLYLVSGTRMGTKPATRSSIAMLLVEAGKNSEFLSSADKEEFRFLMAEFRADIPARKGMVWDDNGPLPVVPDILKRYVYRNRRNLLSTAGDGYSLYLDPVICRSAEISSSKAFSRDDRVYESGNGFIMRGTVGEHIGFYADIRDSKEWGSRDYPDEKVTTTQGRGYVSFKGDRAEFDETQAHIAYTNGPFVVSYGRGSTIWGRGKSGTLGVSDYASPYDMLRFETGFWRLKFMFIAAEIEQFPPIAKFYYNNPTGVSPDSVAVKKYMSGHRVEIDFTDRFSMGFYETVVYGGRWDMSYLNPLMFFTGAEHSNGDHDNAAMGMDFRLFVHRSHSVYGELFIDDISMKKLGTDWYGNKLAYQIGTYIVEPFGFRDVDARIEYSRINPWVYTHKFPITGYHHYSDVLGYPSGPNSDVVSVELRKRFSRRFHSAFSLTSYRYGANPPGENVGGDPLEGHRDGDSTKAKFLQGNREKSTAVGIDLSYEVFWQLFLRAGYTWEDRDGDGINIYRVSLGLNE